MNHTPGPWKYLGQNEESCFVGLGPDHKIAVGGFTWNDAEANARLIAAAPELLEALQMVLDYLNTGDMRPLDLRKASAAITKARGES